MVAQEPRRLTRARRADAPPYNATDVHPRALCVADPGPDPRRARERRAAVRRPPAGAQQLREPRLPGLGWTTAASVVAKFYRPGRWTDAQILEEHAFVAGTGGARDPGRRRRWRSTGRRCTASTASASRCTRSHGGRAPELDDPRHAGMDGALHRPHPRGRRAWRRSRTARRSTSRRFGDEPRAFLLAHAFMPPDLRRRLRSVVAPGAGGRAPLLRARRRRANRCACTATATPATCCGPTTARTSSTSTTPHGPGGAGPVDAAVGRARRHDAPARATCSPATRTSSTSTARELHLIEALRTLRLIHYAAWLARRWDDPAFPAAFPWFNTQRYWQDRILELREQIALMDEEPLVA